MSERNPATGSIVVGVDGSNSALQAARWAGDLASRRRTSLCVVNAYGIIGQYARGGTTPEDDFRTVVGEDVRKILTRAADEASAAAEGVQVEAAAYGQSTVSLLHTLSRDAAMIVLGGSEHNWFTRMLTASTAVSLMSDVYCPVVVVRTRDGMLPSVDDGPVVVGVDGGGLSERAMGHAFEQASSRGVSLRAVHARNGNLALASAFFTENRPEEDIRNEHAGKQLLTERLTGWQEKYPDVVVDPTVEREHPQDALIEHSGSAQLLVVGSRGRGRFTGRFLGSTSHAAVYHADCPVMIVRSGQKDGEESS